MKIFAFAFLLLVTQALAGPVSHFGALKRCGNHICGSKNGTESVNLLLKGPSLYWSDGSGSPFYNVDVVDWFVDNMQISVIRAAMAIRYYKENSEPVDAAGGVKGYYFTPDVQKAIMKKIVDAAIANDIYVIVDWHSHQAHNETQSAKDFFVWMANEYKDVPNIIWEVYNEPIGAGASQVNAHAKTIIDALKAAGNTNLTLIGSPSYSTQPSGQTSAWGANDNVAFTFHFYAASHSFPNAGGGSSAQTTMSSGFPVFASEWGAVNYDGDGSPNVSASNSWTEWMDREKISNCMWNASSLSEGSSFFTSGTGSASLATNKLTESGKYFQTYMTKNPWTGLVPSTHPKAKDIVVSLDDGASKTFTAADLGLTGTITEVKSRDPSITVEATNTANSITYKADGSKKGKIVLIYKVNQGTVTIQNKITVNISSKLPSLPQIDPISVSRKAKTTLNLLTTLAAQDPEGKGLTITNVAVDPPTAGTAAFSGNDITFTPDPSMSTTTGTEAALKYTVKNGSGSRTASVELRIQNLPPTIRDISSAFSGGKFPNTAPVTIDMSANLFNGKDPDGDDIKFAKMYLDPRYPGTLAQVGDNWIYTPDPSKIGKITFLAIITDGTSNSLTGRANITLEGSGTDIGTITPPTSIPGSPQPPTPPVDPIDPGPIDPGDPTVVYQFNAAKSLGMASIGSGKVQLYLAQSGVAKLDIYSLSGKKVGNLLSGHQNAGSKQVSLNSLNLQKGVYILRLSQGSQVKTLRVVN